MSDHLAELERRAHELEVFLDCRHAADEYITRNGTRMLVDELRRARADQRRMKLGTTNALILLAHIDQLEAERPETDEADR